MLRLSPRLPSRLRLSWTAFSFVGLAVAALSFAASLTPSLLPRHFAVQGLLSGLALAVGYGIGVSAVWVWVFLELPKPAAGVERWAKLVTTLAVCIVAALFLRSATIWQNSIRKLMEMEPVATAYPWRVAVIALVTCVVLIAAARGLCYFWRFVDRKVSLLVPRRVSYVVSSFLVALLLLLLVNNVLAKLALDAADAVFLELDMVVKDGIEQPIDPAASGSADSLVDWETIGRQGKAFIVAGPTKQEISEFWGKEALRPLRVYVGLASKESMHERAKLALEELRRAGGFDRSVLVVATPTGTGWLDPGAVDTLEYLHAGDTAIVSMQYSYLPSWITILVDPLRSRDSATYLFDEIYNHWTTLPKNSRPRLYLHGLSLGSLGSESSADIFTVFEDPIHGAVWSGPPFPSTVWARATNHRNPGSPMWLPKFRDGSMLRFTAQKNALNASGTRWGPMRFVYVQHASDPMTFFAPSLLYQRPAWLVGQRGPDVSPYLRWYPVVTFLQAGFDIPMATSVPTGYGHNFAPSSYIDAWVAVSEPAAWSAAETSRLKQHFTQP